MMDRSPIWEKVGFRFGINPPGGAISHWSPTREGSEDDATEAPWKGHGITGRRFERGFGGPLENRRAQDVHAAETGGGDHPFVGGSGAVGDTHTCKRSGSRALERDQSARFGALVRTLR